MDTGMQHLSGNVLITLHTHLVDYIYDHNTEGKACNGIHGAVALGERLKQGTTLAGSIRDGGKSRCARTQQGRYDQDSQEK